MRKWLARREWELCLLSSSPVLSVTVLLLPTRFYRLRYGRKKIALIANSVAVSRLFWIKKLLRTELLNFIGEPAVIWKVVGLQPQ